MIKKEGKIVDLTDKKVVVEIENRSLCGNCHQKEGCLLTDCKNKIIEVDVNDAALYGKGQNVKVCLEEKEAWLALFFAYVLPLILLVSSLSVLMFFTQNELKSAVISLFLMMFYYVLLFFFRKFFSKRVRFVIIDE